MIHTVNKLFPLIYFLPESVKRLIKSRTTYEVSDYSIVCEKAYKINGIPVFRKPLFKWIPRGLTSARTIRRCARSIADDLQKVGFVPDVIPAWASPSAQLLSRRPNALAFTAFIMPACIRRCRRPAAIPASAPRVKFRDSGCSTRNLYCAWQLRCAGSLFPKIPQQTQRVFPYRIGKIDGYTGA